MTNLSTIASSPPDLIGPGHLILVVGPSGAGKDTLIGLAQAKCAGDNSFVFAQRVVTREASAYENNIAVAPATFGRMLTQGDFVLHWQAHGLSYGLPNSVVSDVRTGRVVIANVSRNMIVAARQIFSHVSVILVMASPDVLATRLAARARRSDGKLDHRLARSVDAVTADVTINNVGSAEDHCAEFLLAIRSGCDRARRDGPFS